MEKSLKGRWLEAKALVTIHHVLIPESTKRYRRGVMGPELPENIGECTTVLIR